VRLIVQAGALARGGLWDASSRTHHSAAFSSGGESFSSKIRRVGVSGQDPPLGGVVFHTKGWSSCGDCRRPADDGCPLSHPILQGKPNASHVCARINLHTHDRQNESNTIAVIKRSRV
jgi:hypothetical protein